MDGLRKIKTAYSILSGFFIAAGLLFLIKPETALSCIFKICGIITLLFGIVKLLGYFSKDNFQLAFQFDLSLGIISCVIGLVSLFKPKITIEILGAVLGIFVLADTASKLQTALDARRFGMDNWKLLFAAALTASAIGILLFIFPLKGTGFIIRLIGLNLVMTGILNLLIVQSCVKTVRRNKE